MEQTKICSKCREDKPLTEYYRAKNNKDGFHGWCKECYNVYQRLHWKDNNNARRAITYKHRYDITIDDYDRMFEEQGGKCSICGTTEPGKGKYRLSVDHNKDTGQVRGLLCHGCNVAIGLMFHNIRAIERAAEYLRKWE